MDNLEIITHTEWEKAVKSRLRTSEFKLLNCKVKPLGTTGGGFLGEHFLAEITIRLENSSEEQTLHYFLKSEPQTNEDQKMMLDQTGSFRKEVDALSNLFIQMRSALKDGGKGMEWTCKCFYTRPDVIVLENMVHMGYRILGRRETMGYQRCALILKALANLHSASLIFEETRPTQPYRLDQEYEDILREGFFRHAPNHPGTAWLRTGREVALKLAEEIRGEETVRRIGERLGNAVESLYEYEKTSERFRNVVNHGDLWRNNMFFLHEEGEAVSARLVDFQLVRYVPPANDVSCLLYLTTNRSFRKQYYSQLLALYHDHLSQNLKRHGLDPEKVLSWKEFKESCDFYKRIGVVVAVHFKSFILLKSEELTHVFASSSEFERFMVIDRRPEVVKNFRNDPFYRENLTEVIEELIEEFIDD